MALLALSSVTSAQESKKMTREEYINTYAPVAVEQMACFGIPASITLAQGLLESGNGNSTLAREANNHFGIKCSNSWNGKTYRHDDDAPQECFRVYDSVLESYIDHSMILMERPWYQPLFELDMKDYKAWAHGLKKAGYATNPKYAYHLIDIIEKYELYKYDNALLADYNPAQTTVESTSAAEQVSKEGEVVEQVTPEESVESDTEESVESDTEATTTPEQNAQEAVSHKEPHATPQKVDIDSYDIAIQRVGGYGIYTQDGRKYIITKEGDTLASIAKTLGVSKRSLRKYNELDRDYTVSAGDRLFIER